MIFILCTYEKELKILQLTDDILLLIPKVNYQIKSSSIHFLRSDKATVVLIDWYEKFNSYDWGMAFRRHLTSKGISRTFLIVQSLRLIMVIPAKNTFTTYVIYKFSSKFSWNEKKLFFFTSRFVNFSDKSNSSGCKNLK